MSIRMRSSAARKRNSNGNVILESVFTLLPTFAFIFAFTDFGLMMFRWSTLQNALREGTRYAVTFQTQAGLGQDASIAERSAAVRPGICQNHGQPGSTFSSTIMLPPP